MSKDVMPAGSLPPEEPEEGANANPETEPKKEEQGSEEKVLGKFKDPAELEKAYLELEKTLGRQKSELGDLRQRLETVQSQPQQPEQGGQETVDFAQLREDIQKQIDEGDLSLAEGLAKMTEIAKQETAAELEAKFEAYDEKREAEKIYSDFVSKNPDFLELENSGALDEEMSGNPMHDKFSAYYAVKARLESEAAYARGKEEALKIAKGADGTRSVLTKPGGNLRDTGGPKKGMPEPEKVAGMIAALQAARGQ